MRTVVMGAGKSGVASANFLAMRGEEVVLCDSNPSPVLPFPLAPEVATQFGAESISLEHAGTVILSPGVPPSDRTVLEAAMRGIPVISEVELAFRHLSGFVIGVTGSNGKSTTTALIGAILSVAGRQPIVAGNIGVPLISVVDLDKPRTYVVELSSFQLETIDTFRPDIAVLLNVTPDHMDRYASFDAYAAAKYAIFRNQRSGDFAVVNASERRGLTRDSMARVLRFSSAGSLESEGAWFDGADMVVRVDGQQRKMPRASLRLRGQANAENALAAWLVARAAGIEDIDVQIAFGSFEGLPHRMVVVREAGGVTYINDSKGTNVDATIRSLEGFPDQTVILILGGKDKSGEFERMREVVSAKVRTVLTIGQAGEKVAAALEGAAVIEAAGDMEGAVRWARANARDGETVLLSPACASFDQYRNFEHRGEHFEELVRSL